MSRQDFQRTDAVLQKHLSYYRALSEKGKIRFVSRTLAFMKDKDFQGANDLEVTEEMKILVSASAVQLTFGMEKFLLSNYHTIILTPSPFYTNRHKERFKGLTTGSGKIFLSWADFLSGYQNDRDKYNLGLHEMAHALKHDLEKGYDFDNRFAFYLDNWMEIGMTEFQKMKHSRGQESFLRSYGGANIDEFFAVCIEHFFEAPEEFCATLPEIFYHLCYLMNQNPLQPQKDYALTPGLIKEAKKKSSIPLPEQLKRNYKYHNWHWSLTIIVLGMFPGLIANVLLGVMTLMPVTAYLAVGGITMLLTAVIQFPYLLRHNLFGWTGCFVYALLGTVPLSFALFLGLNYGLRNDNTMTLSYPVTGVIQAGQEKRIVLLKDDKWWGRERFRATYSQIEKPPTTLTVTLREGGMGFYVFESNSVK